MSDIFISYAREDRPRAEAIAKALEAHGWSVWWDRDIRAGKNIALVIEEEIGKARCVVVLWSAVSVRRDWVNDEAREGNERGILVPVMIEDVRPPLGFRSMHAADLTAWQRDGKSPAFARLCADIEALIGPSVKAPRPYRQHRSPQSTRSSRSCCRLTPARSGGAGRPAAYPSPDWCSPGTFRAADGPQDRIPAGS